MGILNKIFTAIKGGAREVGESIVDANGIRIMEQELKDSEAELHKAKQGLTEIMAKKIQAEREISKLEQQIKQHEDYATQAIEKNDESLALEIAEKISQFQPDLEIQLSAKEKFEAHSNKLKNTIKKSCASLANMKRQLLMVKTTENVQKATKSINNSYAGSGSKLLSAKESLDRIKQRQENFEDKLIAGEELYDDIEGNSLEKKLAQAGITQSSSNAKDILAKIKAKKT